ncbi:helix-turn-helix transcriptional regulator [Oleispirillum naphthae]|uniref:helix-turn-helix domain-containing protein n=1 Tax=Oleispirillum naphthae TaxID=2838853 RepID=UPI00308245FF
MMHLRDWLTREGITPSAFARKCGLPPSTINRILSDGRAPTDEVMRRIIVGSHGEVQPNDFFPIAELLKGA